MRTEGTWRDWRGANRSTCPFPPPPTPPPSPAPARTAFPVSLSAVWPGPSRRLPTLLTWEILLFILNCFNVLTLTESQVLCLAVGPLENAAPRSWSWETRLPLGHLQSPPPPPRGRSPGGGGGCAFPVCCSQEGPAGSGLLTQIHKFLKSNPVF